MQKVGFLSNFRVTLLRFIIEINKKKYELWNNNMLAIFWSDTSLKKSLGWQIWLFGQWYNVKSGDFTLPYAPYSFQCCSFQCCSFQCCSFQCCSFQCCPFQLRRRDPNTPRGAQGKQPLCTDLLWTSLDAVDYKTGSNTTNIISIVRELCGVTPTICNNINIIRIQ